MGATAGRTAPFQGVAAGRGRCLLGARLGRAVGSGRRRGAGGGQWGERGGAGAAGRGRWPSGCAGVPGKAPMRGPMRARGFLGRQEPSRRLAQCQALAQSSPGLWDENGLSPRRRKVSQVCGNGARQGFWESPPSPSTCSQMSFCPPRHLVPGLWGIPRLLSYWFLLTFKFFLLRERGRGTKVRKEQIKTNQNKLPLPERKLTSIHPPLAHKSVRRPQNRVTLLERQPDRTELLLPPPHLPFW